MNAGGRHSTWRKIERARRAKIMRELPGKVQRDIMKRLDGVIVELEAAHGQVNDSTAHAIDRVMSDLRTIRLLVRSIGTMSVGPTAGQGQGNRLPDRYDVCDGNVGDKLERP